MDSVSSSTPGGQSDRHVIERIGEIDARLDRLEGAIRLLLDHAGITYDLAAERKPQFSPLVLELVKAGRTVEAIKAYRDDTGAGMKEAKAAIDELARS
jgi:ribosomal protein L7/L12